MSQYASAQQVVSDIGTIFKPPRRKRVSDAVEEAVMIATPGGFAGKWSGDQTPYMREPMDLISSRDFTSVIFAGPARTGKALALDTLIPTPTGWTTIGELQPGEHVLGDDGKPVMVDFVTEPMFNHPCYKVEFSDGESIVADEDHLWAVTAFNRDGTKKKLSEKTLTTGEMLPCYKSGKRNLFAVNNTQPLTLKKTKLSVDPYVLGLWLGDGTSNCGQITTGECDLLIAEHIRKAGHVVEVRQKDTRNPNVYNLAIDPKPIEGDICFRGHSKREIGTTSTGWCAECSRQNHHKRKHGVTPDKEVRKHKGLSWHLLKLNLINNKHIPQRYLRASYAQRLALLQGLMDSDGHCDKRQGACSYTSTIRQLVDGVYELLMTMGIRARMRERQTHAVNNGVKVKGKISWTIDFHTYRDTAIFRLPRKLNAQQERPKLRAEENSRRRIVSIDRVESVPVKCIRVMNESHLFLAGKGMVPTHNTQGLIDGGIGYIITCDPADILVVHMTEEAARRYSRLRIRRMLNNSPMLKEKLSTVAHDDNVLGKYFKNGTALILAWPSPTQLSAQDYKYVFLSDYDRMPDDTGEGDVYTLASKRTQTFMSGGMTVVESSPGRDFLDKNWKPSSPHEAPPVGGILGLYNTGDRRLWHWNCVECKDPFAVRPGLDLFALPETSEMLDRVKFAGTKTVAAEFAKITCPNCGVIIEHRFKNAMNLDGFWKTENDHKSSVASFWLGGAAAKFQTWSSLIEKELQALNHFALTGEEEKLKATRNTDQGIPYLPSGGGDKLNAQELEARSEDMAQRVVPVGVRFLIAAIDVQGSKFVVQVSGYGVDLESWVIDRFDIAISERESHGEMAVLDPAGHKEDWDLITKRVILKRYRLDDETSRTMGVTLTTCDSGGKAGVTENAYHFWKRLKDASLVDKFALIKGERPKRSANKPMVGKTSPDKASKAARNAKVTNELPLWLLNTTILKDAVMANLKRVDHGPDFVHFPKWLPLWFYEEVTAETRSENGWENPGRTRNEAFDLLCYTKAGYLIKLDGYWKAKINWDKPPGWAEVWDNNAEVSNQAPAPTSPQTKSRVRRVRMRTAR